MDFLLYGIFTLDLAKQITLSGQPLLELARTPFAVNLGICAALLVPFLVQSKVRTGLIWFSFACLLIMTGIIFSGLFFLACISVYFLACLLQSWPGVDWRKRYLLGFLLINAVYFPLFFVTFPPFDGFMSVGEIALLWGPAFAVFRSIHYIHMVCREKVDAKGARAFAHFLHYMVHFPSFWFGPFQKFRQFDDEVSTCKARLTRANRKRGLLRIGLGFLKLFFVFHVFNLPVLYKQDYYGPFADVLFADAGSIEPATLWMLVYYFALRIFVFMSAINDGVVGMNLLLGIRVPENTNWPLFARNVREFWQRWNVQVSVFLRDEVYFPLRKVKNRNLVLLIVFAYSGFWHFPSFSAIVVFSILQVVLFWLTQQWDDFWQYHNDQGDQISRWGKQFYLCNSKLSGFLGCMFVLNINVLSVVFIHDHFYGGTRVLPRMFGFD